MELNSFESTRQTKSGVFVKFDKNIGLLAFAPKVGLTYAIHKNHASQVLEWLEGSLSSPPSAEYVNSIGAGWSNPMDEFRSAATRLLPRQELWETLPSAASPVLINWLLTGICPLNCKYCYAEDLMRGIVPEPQSEKEIKERALEILRLSPLVVVLTGGDPLSSRYLRTAIECLSGKVGLIIDTSAYGFTNEKLELFKRHNVTVRISLDSDRPALNERQRPLLNNRPGTRPTALSAVSAICACLDNEIPITVQTVATKKTAHNLVEFGDKLFRMGVRSWRVFKVAPSNAKIHDYHKLLGKIKDSGESYKGKKNPSPYAFNFEKIRKARSGRWQSKMDVQTTGSEHVHSVILVGPDGVFYTESITKSVKIPIDRDSPKSPSLAAIGQKVHLNAHAERYLNLDKS